MKHLTPEQERYLDGDPADFPNRESAKVASKFDVQEV